jgi:hypothetical protein
MAGGPRKTVFSTLAKTADRKEDRRIKQDTRSILIVLFTPREVKIKVLKQRRLTSNQKFSSRTSSISVESSYHQSQIFTKVARAIFWLCLSDLDRSTAGYGRYSGFSDPGFWVGALFTTAWRMFSPDRAKHCRPPRTCQRKAQQNRGQQPHQQRLIPLTTTPEHHLLSCPSL